jgi:hypothetical protein
MEGSGARCFGSRKVPAPAPLRSTPLQSAPDGCRCLGDKRSPVQIRAPRLETAYSCGFRSGSVSRRCPLSAQTPPPWFIEETGDVSVEELQLVSSAMTALPATADLARPVLREVVAARGL